MKKGQKHTMIHKGLIMPDRFFTKLTYYDTDTSFVNVGGTLNYAFRYYNANGLYDINPALASSVVPGTSAFQNSYRSYRVRAAKIIFEVANVTSEPILITLHAQTDYHPTTFDTWAKVVSLTGNKYTKQRTLSAITGMDRGKLSLYADFSVMNGNKQQYLADADYTGTLTYTPSTPDDSGSNPNNLFYFYCIVSTVDSSPFDADAVIPIRVLITQYVEFFRRIDMYE